MILEGELDQVIVERMDAHLLHTYDGLLIINT